METMTEALEIVFRGDGSDRLIFLMNGRRYPDDKDVWHANWMAVDVSIQVGPFSGKVSGEFRNEHFHDFYKDLTLLHETLKGKATFYVDQRVNLYVEALSRGRIRIYGSVHDVDYDRNILNFNIFTDQSYMNEPLKQLGKIVNLYPVLYQQPKTNNQ
jgi:hypothetical protein